MRCAAQIDEQHVVVGAARHDLVAALEQARRHEPRVREHLPLIGGERRLERFLERDGFGGDDVHQRAALRAGEHGRVDALRQRRTPRREDHAAARAAQRLVRRRRRDVGDCHGARIETGRDEPRDVRDVGEEQRADLVGDRAKPRPIDDSRVRREARNDELRPVRSREGGDLRVVELARRRRHVVRHDVVERARLVLGRTVRAVPAVRGAHAEQRVARRQQREIRGEIRLRARVRLHVRVAGAEQSLRTLDREPLRDVGELAARVVALAGIAVGVLVRQQRALRREHARAHVVLRGDELEVRLLPLAFARERALELGVEVGEAARVEHRQAASSSTTRVQAVARFVRL